MVFGPSSRWQRLGIAPKNPILVGLKKGLQLRAIGLGHLQQGMVRRTGEDHQALGGEFLPTLHRTGGDKVVFRSKKQNGQVEGSQAGFRRTPVSNDIHPTPIAAWVPWDVGR
jgi:hypothetical protein